MRNKIKNFILKIKYGDEYGQCYLRMKKMGVASYGDCDGSNIPDKCCVNCPYYADLGE